MLRSNTSFSSLKSQPHISSWQVKLQQTKQLQQKLQQRQHQFSFPQVSTTVSLTRNHANSNTSKILKSPLQKHSSPFLFSSNNQVNFHLQNIRNQQRFFNSSLLKRQEQTITPNERETENNSKTKNTQHDHFYQNSQNNGDPSHNSFRQEKNGNSGPKLTTMSGDKSMAWWLIACCFMVLMMIIIGGLTRLTGSGLSMTDWKFTGSLPPMSQEEWEEEFEKYQQFPEYKLLNNDMTLNEFKFIFFMEYFHRMFGRMTGAVFGVPFLYFGLRKRLTAPVLKRFGLLLGMGVGQGFLGWYMVQSGLQDPEEKRERPRVWPTRLAAHLMSAVTIYSTLYWTSLRLMPSMNNVDVPNTKVVNHLRHASIGAAAVMLTTIASGAFVAGNDAGRAYNTFPLMGGNLVPAEYWDMQPTYKNFLKNVATVQFNHRVMATTSLGLAGYIFFRSRGIALPRHSRFAVAALLGTTCFQYALGITTLLNFVPVSLGTAHQAGAIGVLTAALHSIYSLRTRKPLRTRVFK
eukprot:gb/GECH01014346.1/.p1 GENE.gb/GECH01014346.1/~~gb/GECH01014346.1/.p1  ORF type:complete len:517 (+),score=99.69 gb/GECH01014346.1/:1-1551(+)